MANRRRLALVEVTWRDIVSDSSWTPDDEVDKQHPADCRSVGYLRRWDDDNLLLSHTVNGDGSDYTTIPSGAVSGVRNLRRAGARTR